MAERTVKVRLIAEYTQFVAAMSRAGASVKTLGAEVAAATKTEKGRASLEKLSTAAMGLGAAMAAPAAAAVKLSADFEAAMSNVKANVDDKSAPAMAKLKAAALDAGKSTQYSAIEAAEGEDELAKAGLSVTDIVNGGLKGALSLAAAGQVSVGEAAETAASAMVQFGLAGKDIPHIADLLAAGADKAQGGVQDLANALKYVGPVASSMGVSIESTIGVLTEFANQGVIGERAGTGLRGVLSSLTSPSNLARQEMQKLGLQLYDSNGKFVGLADTAQQLHDKLGGLTAAQRDAALGTIFGNAQITTASVLMNGGAKAVNKYTKEVNDSGFAATSAATKMDNLHGDLQKLKSAMETSLIETGSGANSALRKIAQSATGVVTQFASLPKSLQEGAVYTAGLSGAALLGFGAYTKLKTKITETVEALNDLGPAGQRVGNSLKSASAVVGKLTLILAGLQAASAAMGRDVSVPLDKLDESLLQFARNGKVAGTATTILGKNLKQFREDIIAFGTGSMEKLGTGIATTIESFTGLGRVMNDSVYHAQQRMSQLDQSLSDLVSSGHGDQAKAIFDRLLKATKEEGGNINDLKNALPGYSAAIGAMSNTQAQAEKTTNDAAAAYTTMTGSVKQAIDAIGSLTQVWDQLNGKMASTDSAMLDATNALGTLKQSLTDNGKSFSRNTKAGLENRTAMESVSQKAAAAAQAVYEETGSVDQATKTWNKYKTATENMLVSMGLTRKEAKALVDQMFQFPKDIKVPTSTPGAKKSSDELKDLKKKEDALKKKINIAVKDNAGASSQRVKDLQNQLNKLHDREIWIKTHNIVYHTDTYTAYRTDAGGKALVPRANGGIDYLANGGFRGGAEIVPGGTMRVMAEPQTGGEAFIPLAPSKRVRSRQIYAETGRRLGLTPTVSSRGPSAAEIASALSQQLSGPLSEVAQAILADKNTSVRVGQLEIARAVSSANKFRKGAM